MGLRVVEIMKASQYLNSITDEKYTSEKGYALRVKPLLENLTNPCKVLVVGVSLGGIEELDGLHYYRPDLLVYGIDLSIAAIKRRHNFAKHETEILVLSDLAHLPFGREVFDGILCSAVMHEVFSYSEDGDKNLLAALTCIERSLTEQGVLLIRDFHVPDTVTLKVTPKTIEASDFVDKFICGFRQEFEPSFVKRFQVFHGEIISDSRSIYELLVHFRMANRHFNTIEDFFYSKEIEERYFSYSVKDYKRIMKNTCLYLGRVVHHRFDKYYSVINDNFVVSEQSGKKHSLVLGFDDLYVFKRSNK
jgi:ubiquinone/menaquinone biosynthesis C-methylase UbiE